MGANIEESSIIKNTHVAMDFDIGSSSKDLIAVDNVGVPAANIEEVMNNDFVVDDEFDSTGYVESEFENEEQLSNFPDDQDVENVVLPEANNEDVMNNDYVLDDDFDATGYVGSEFEKDEQLPNFPNDQESNFDVFETTGGTRYWIPRVDENFRIAVGSEFPSVQSGDDAYMKYAKASGFVVRKSNMKKGPKDVVTNRYLLCSKEGFPPKKDFDSIDMLSGKRTYRNSNVKRSGCKARIEFKLIKGTTNYVVCRFEEKHNHPLLSSQDMRLTRPNRQLQYTDYRKVFNASSASIGASRTHRMEAALKGGYEYMDATAVDYENARRDMGNFVGNKDAQMLVNLLAKRKRNVPAFFFEYFTVDKELQAIFWVDEIARLNYKEFGDFVSFDATYRMNEHAMIFIPFISIDNHKKSVVVGSALVTKEDAVNYTWVLKAFVKAHGKQPLFVITDQCAAMKKAIPAVLTDSKHRLCMWHIMKKLPNKISGDPDANRLFKKRFNKLVWNTHITPEDFENEWRAIMEEYDLRGHGWLNDMYEIRQQWVLAYYIDDPMSGLMKTTSRSESSHSFFRIYAHYCNDLVKFLHAFDCAIEKQRNKHRCLEYVTRNTLPRCITPLLIERHASEVFTRTVFFELQKEIRKAVWFCGLELVGTEGDIKWYRASHKNKKSFTKAVYMVEQDVVSKSMKCACNFFVRNGIICRHMIKVMLNDDVQSIPEMFVARRWTRDLVPVEIQAARARYGEVDVKKERLINGIYSKVDLLVSRMRNDKSKLRLLFDTLEKMKVDFDVDMYAVNTAIERLDALRDCYGVDVPETADILPPTGIRNKGCGTGKRLKGPGEKAATKKPKRMCKKCSKMANHDSRNCPKI